MATAGSRSARSAASACCDSSPTAVAVAPSSLRRNNACRVLLAGAGCFLLLALAVLLVKPFPGDAAARGWVLGYGSAWGVQAARGVKHPRGWGVIPPPAL